MSTLTYSQPDDGYNALGPTTAVELAGDHTDDDGQAIDDILIPNPNLDGVDHGDAPQESNPFSALSFEEDRKSVV